MNKVLSIAAKRKDLLIPIGIFIFALVIRVVNLGQFLTADEPRSWYGWSMEFTRAIVEGRLEDTIYSGSPGVTLFWLGAIGLYLAYLFQFIPSPDFATFLSDLPFDPILPDIIFWFQLPGTVLGAISVTITYLLAKRLFNLKIALVGSLLIAFDPLIIGMNRVLSTDGVAVSFVTNAVLAMLLFAVQQKKSSYKMLIISAIFTGLALLTKTTALYLLPFFGLVLLVTILYNRAWSRLPGYIIAGLIWIGVALLTTFIFWPALWLHPLGTLQQLLERLRSAVGEPHNRGSFFWGSPVRDPGIWFYWVMTYFRLTAVTTVGLVLGALYLFFKKAAVQARKLDVVFLFLFIIFYIIFLSLGEKKNDRYITLLLPIANLLAAVGYVWITGRLQRVTWQNASLLAVVILQVVLAIQHSPYYLSHYNLLAGGGRTASDKVLVGWGEGLDQAAAYLNTLPDAQSLKVSSWYHSNFEPFFHGIAVEKAGDEKISRSAKPALASDYAVLYINQIQRQMPTPGMIQFYQNLSPKHIVKINNIDYAFIYPSLAVEHMLSGEARLVGQAELLGYNLLDEQAQPFSELPADSTAIIELYWEWQGKSPDEFFRLSLVDETGETWGVSDSSGTQARLPFAEWAEGMVAHDAFVLTVFPGTPPGDYYLKAWIDRPATGETVGFFPLNQNDVRIRVSRPAAPPAVDELDLSPLLPQSVTSEIMLLGLGQTETMPETWPAGEGREWVLYWQANETVPVNYPLTFALLDVDGVIQAEWPGQPTHGRFPPDQWQSGDIIRDPWALTLPAYVPPGEYALTVALGDEPPVTLVDVSVTGRSRNFAAPSVDLPVDVQFGNGIKLLGLQANTDRNALSVAPGEPLDLALVWQAANLIDGDYNFTIQLLDGENQVRVQQDGVPLVGLAPTSSWTPGEILTDELVLELSPDLGSGPHRLLVAFYHPDTGERLLLADGSDHLEIPVEVK